MNVIKKLDGKYRRAFCVIDYIKYIITPAIAPKSITPARRKQITLNVFFFIDFTSLLKLFYVNAQLQYAKIFVGYGLSGRGDL